MGEFMLKQVYVNEIQLRALINTFRNFEYMQDELVLDGFDLSQKIEHYKEFLVEECSALKE